MSEIAVEPSEAVAVPEPALPLEALDRCLDPIRRVLLYAVRDGHGTVPYLGATSRLWVDRALKLDLPLALRDGIAILRGTLEGLDALEDAERAVAVGNLHQQLMRLDAVLGLPLRGRRSFSRSKRRVIGNEVAEEPAAKPASSRGESKGSSRRRVRSQRKARANEKKPKVEEDKPRRARQPTSWHLHAAPDLGGGPEWEAAGLHTVADLLFRRPLSVERLSPIQGAGRDIEPGRVAVGGRVGARITTIRPDGGRTTTITLVGAGPVAMRLPPGASMEQLAAFEPGARVVVAGTYVDGETPHLQDPEIVMGLEQKVAVPSFGVPDVPDRQLRATRRATLGELGSVRDPLPAGYRPKGPSLQQAVAHAFRDPAGRRRLAWLDAFLLQLGLAGKRFAVGKERGVAHPTLHKMASRLESSLELTFGDSAALALEEIKRDVRMAMPMRRLLLGPAGSGRGAIALMTIATVAESRSQVAVVCDDVGRLTTHFTHCEPVLRELGLVTRLGVPSVTRAQRDALRRGEVHVLFATPDALADGSDFRRLGLVVAYEGRERGAVVEVVERARGAKPDLLVVPVVPPTCADLLGVYGPLAISEVTAEGGAIESIVLPGAERSTAYDRAAEVVGSGGQALVLFPLVDGADALDQAQARRVVAAMQAEVFPGQRVKLLHGDASRDEQYRIYDDFRHHRFDVLVATTPVEDGPPVAGLGAVVVEQADRVDVTRLRRARATVRGRGGVCLFVTGEVPDTAGAEWLATVAAGAGQVLTEQLAGGVPDDLGGPWLDLPGDVDVLLEARRAAHRLIARDPALRRNEHGDVVRAATWRWPALSDEPCPLGTPAPAARGRRRRRRKRR